MLTVTTQWRLDVINEGAGQLGVVSLVQLQPTGLIIDVTRPERQLSQQYNGA
jgi:hypothetical protein